MATPYKLCPRCQNAASLEAVQCVRCGHMFRTQFAPPAATVMAPPPRPAAAKPRRPLGCFQIGCLSIVALFLLGLVVSGMQSVYDATPAGQQRRAEQIARLQQAGNSFWQAVRQSDPGGSLFVSYEITDADAGGVVWVTISNQWFYMPSGEQDQTYDMLRRAWGRCLGEEIGPVIIADVAGRQLR